MVEDIGNGLSGDDHIFTFGSVEAQKVFISPAFDQRDCQLKLGVISCLYYYMAQKDIIHKEIDLGAEICNAGW